MTSGGQCVMTAGTLMMLLWSANSWDMHTLEVSTNPVLVGLRYLNRKYYKFQVKLMNLQTNLGVFRELVYTR